MSSELLEPPGAEMCVFLLREEEEEEERRKEVGCQWECPEERREVGCQSETAERRDAAVQVDLLSQQLNLRQTESSAVLLQCIAVRPDGPDGGALLQHCTSHNKQSAVKHQTPPVLGPSLSAKHTPSRSSRIQRKKPESQAKAGLSAARSSAPLSHRRSPSLRRRAAAQRVPFRRISPHSRRCCSPPSSEEEEEVRPERDEEEEEVVEEEGDPNWTPPRGESGPQASLGLQQGDASLQPESQQEALEALKLELESTVCDVCGKVMKCKSSLARHSFIHTGKKPYGCHLCELRFNRRDNLQHHLNRLHPDGVAKLEKRRADVQTWLCEVCGKTFNCKSRLKTHEAIHSGVKPYRCDLCPKAYMRNNDLEHHKKIVHVDGADELPKPSSLLCDFCGKEFKCKSQLAIHFQTHTGERPHLCDICGRKFGRSYQLKRHRILVHINRVNTEESPQPDLPFVCGVCGKRLKSEALLMAHTQIHTSDKPHRCSICLRSFLRATCLKQHHIRVHLKMKVNDLPQPAGRKRSATAAKLFPCPICCKVFKFKSLLASHSVIHTEVKPHSCEFCNRSFRRQSHLKRHLEVVHANGARLPQTYVCQVCGLDKKCKSQLARHVIIHTGERPHACDLCPARFNRSGNLQQHKRRMHGVGKESDGEATPTLLDENGDSFDSVLAPALTYKQEETVVTMEPADDDDGFDPGGDL